MLPPPFRAMDPADALGWHAVADWLEEHDQPDRAELVRLTRLLLCDLTHPDRPAREARQMELLAAGVEPCVATLTNGIGMEFVYIPAGKFLMGSPPEEEGREANEGPVHEVEITRSFWMSKYPVTQAEYRAVVGKNPSYFSTKGGGKAGVKGIDTARFPVEQVSFEDARSFCQELSGRDGETSHDRSYRLPTEAEWEYACRGGPLSKPFHFGRTLSEDQANVDGKRNQPTPVGGFPSNAFGLHDMHGNVWECCADWYDGTYYANRGIKDPAGPQSGTARVLRGGSWGHDPAYCRAAARNWLDPAYRSGSFGLRVCFAWTS